MYRITEVDADFVLKAKERLIARALSFRSTPSAKASSARGRAALAAYLSAVGIAPVVAADTPSPPSIYAALQAQRNTCQDQAALFSAASNEQVAKLQAELAGLKKDFGVEDK